MASTITNQASLTYAYGSQNGSALSNVATAVIEDTLALTKSAVGSDYTPGTNIAYTISLVNNGSVTLNNVTVTDNLGTYALTGANATPLTYVGPARLYINCGSQFVRFGRDGFDHYEHCDSDGCGTRTERKCERDRHRRQLRESYHVQDYNSRNAHRRRNDYLHVHAL